MPTLIFMVAKGSFVSHGNSEPHPFPKKQNLFESKVPRARKMSLNIRLQSKVLLCYLIYMKLGETKKNLALSLNLQIISGPKPIFLLAKHFALD